MISTNLFSKLAVYLLVIIFLGTSLYSNKVFQQETNVITWDVYGYYLYLPAVFIYGDTQSYKFVEEHHHNYQVSSNIYQINKLRDSLYGPTYTMGLALLWLPFFAVAHGVASVADVYPADGLSFPYQLAIVLASLIYCFLGLWFLRKTLLHFFEDKAVALSLLLLTLGTNYFHYICFESGMPHTYVFSLYALLLFCTMQWHRRPTIPYAAAIGIIIGLACLARPSEVIATLIPVLYGTYSKNSLAARLKLLKGHWQHVLLSALCMTLAAMPQILYWKLSISQWLYNGYAGHHFDYLSPHLIEGLFSYRKGWLLYTPMMLFAIAGFYYIYTRRTLSTFRSNLLPFFLLNLYIVFSWHIWWYASSFGARAVIQSYAVLAIPFTAFISHRLFGGRRWVRYLLLLLMLTFTALNQFQDWQYRNRILPFDETTGTYYWKIFGQTHRDRVDYKYIDVDERLPEAGQYQQEPFTRYEPDTVETVLQGTFSRGVEHEVTDEDAARLHGRWLQVEAMLHSEGDAFGKWDAARLIVSFDHQGEPYKWNGLRFQRMINVDEWSKVTFEVSVPAALQSGDIIKAYVWNQSPDIIQLRSIQLNLLLRK